MPRTLNQERDRLPPLAHLPLCRKSCNLPRIFPLDHILTAANLHSELAGSRPIARTFSQSRRPIVPPTRLEKPQKSPNRAALRQSRVPFRFFVAAPRLAPPLARGGWGGRSAVQVLTSLQLITSLPLDHFLILPDHSHTSVKREHLRKNRGNRP